MAIPTSIFNKDKMVSAVLQHFPPVDLAFAYGSAVFKQQGRDLGKMLDLVFAVSDPMEWHRKNMESNSIHYSFLRLFGPSFISNIQRLPAGVYYNTLVKMDSHLIKYGVISSEDLYKDLTEWHWMYISGRLHKPVVLLNNNNRLTKALECNLHSAVLCSLLLMNKKYFALEELFTQITRLSFMGDFRMVVGEDRNKIENIVKPNLSHFKKLYLSIINEYSEPDTNNEEIWRLRNPLSLEGQYRQLPLTVQERVATGQSLQEAITNIVGSSSRKQSLKGIATAGLFKTVRYSAEKLQKMFKSL